MRRLFLSLLLGSAVLTGCRVIPISISTSAVTAPTRAAPSATAAPLSPVAHVTPDRPIILQTASLSLVTEDPVHASASLEELIQESGGYIVSSSSWSAPESGGYASLSARVPPQALANLRRAAIDEATQTQSDSRYSQDVTFEYGLLLQRAADLERADLDLQRLISDARDSGIVSSGLLLRELLLQERKNVESQLRSYHDQMTFASLDVSWTQVAQTTRPVE